MQRQGSEGMEKRPSTAVDTVMGVVMIPVFFAGACLAFPYTACVRWLRMYREHKLRLRMKACGRLIAWQEFARLMREAGGTCIEEKFSPRGPVRFWWTCEDVVRQSPYEIIDWFTMRKGRQQEPFVRWCRARYTHAETGSALLVDHPLAPRREIYSLWSECRSEAAKAQWIEVAPPEILPHRPGE